MPPAPKGLSLPWALGTARGAPGAVPGAGSSPYFPTFKAFASPPQLPGGEILTLSVPHRRSPGEAGDPLLRARLPERSGPALSRGSSLRSSSAFPFQVQTGLDKAGPIFIRSPM